MNKTIPTMLAAAAVAVFASPAFAHDPQSGETRQRVQYGQQYEQQYGQQYGQRYGQQYGQQYGEQYGQYFDGYDSFDELYQHDVDMIQHGVRDGAFTRRQAQEFMAKLQQIRRRELSYRQYDGRLDADEGQDIQRRLARLHNTMHDAHDDGHDAQDDAANRSFGYYPLPQRR